MAHEADDETEERLRDLEAALTRLELVLDSKSDAVNRELDHVKSEASRLAESIKARVELTRYVVVERIVFGLVALTVTTVFAAMLALVVRGGTP